MPRRRALRLLAGTVVAAMFGGVRPSLARADAQCDGKPDGFPCNDGNACTLNDTCQNSICMSGTPISCPPVDQCHDAGTCDANTGVCTNPAKPNGTPCTPQGGG